MIFYGFTCVDFFICCISYIARHIHMHCDTCKESYLFSTLCSCVDEALT